MKANKRPYLSTPQKSVSENFTPRSASIAPRRWAGIAFAMLASIFFVASSLAQQTVILRSVPLRITVPVNGTASNSAVITVTIANGTDPVNLAVTGLPSGSSGSLSIGSFTASGTANLTLLTTNLPAGEYDVAIEASGAASYRLPLPVISSYMWDGDSGTSWATAGNWVGGVAPGSSDPVFFGNLGAQAANTTTNVVIPSNTTVGALRFGQDTTNRFHNLEIQAGATLSVTGNSGFSFLRDAKGVGQILSAKFFGPGALVVNNPAANIALLIDNQQNNTTLDMGGLSNFVANVNRIGFGDYRLYPNFYTNGHTGGGSTGAADKPARFTHLVTLARTNHITASHVDPNNYMDPAIRDYALTFANNEQAGNGTISSQSMRLGHTNAFFLDSICFSQSGGNGNPYSFSAAGSFAYFRNADGVSRMSVFSLSDGAGVNSSGTGVRSTVDFSNGAVDALVDRLYISRERTNSTGASMQGTLTFAAGTFDVNTAIIGFQGLGDNLGTGSASCQGTLNVNGTAVVRVNKTLDLGHTTATNLGASGIDTGFGRLSINNTATVMVSNIVVGGVTKLTTASALNNTITIAASGKLIVTNGIGAPDGKLGTLTMSGSANLSLASISAATTNVHVKNLSASAGVIAILSVPGPGTYSLISYETASVSLAMSLPPGFFGVLVNNAANKTIDAVISTTPPNTLVWRGNLGDDWNHSTLNWVVAGTSTATNFADGDFVIFDNTLTGSGNVNIAENVIPGQSPTVPGIAMTNQSYTFTGGSILGTAFNVKAGTGTWTMNGTSENAVQLLGGNLVVGSSGSVGAVTTATGTTLDSSGIVNGFINVSGIAINTGTVNGAVTLQISAALTNSSPGTTVGTLTLSSNSVVINTGNMNSVGSPGIPGGSFVVNEGTIQGVRVDVNAGGTLRGSGILDMSNRLQGNSGGTLIIGSSIGVLTVTDTLGTAGTPGRVDLFPGSTTIFEVDYAHSNTNDVLKCISLNFGANNAFQGGTLLITNIGATPIAIDSSLKLFAATFGASTAPVSHNNFSLPIITPAPGPGLVWDVSAIRTNGTLRVVGIPTLNPTITSTNLTFVWPTNYAGWRLEVQTNTLAVGIHTNWSTVPNSVTTNSLATNFAVVPIVKTNPAVFYRFAYP